jgi:DNA replication and repair protein RecF
MSIRRLRISQLRNIRQAELELGRVNLVSGPNGSGKTSVLEAVFVLGSGRSFRAARLDPHNPPRRESIHSVRLVAG